MKNRLSLALLAMTLILPGIASAQDEALVLKSRYPKTYTVKEGDTLWSIAALYLRDAWRWPELWNLEGQDDTSRMISPGDVITLKTDNGQPRLDITAAQARSEKQVTVKLSPTIREQDVAPAIPSVATEQIQQFLTRSTVISERELENSAYILSSADNRLMLGTGDQIYVKGLTPGGSARYLIYRQGKTYYDVDEKGGDELGYEGIFIGEAVIDKFGDPSTLVITKTTREAQYGDRILPANPEEFDLNLVPRAPQTNIQGNIISLFDSVSRIGQYQVAVLNVGVHEGVEEGHLLSIKRGGREVDDQFSSSFFSGTTLPSSDAGAVMVFRAYDHVSYALVVKALTDIRLADAVSTP